MKDRTVERAPNNQSRQSEFRPSEMKRSEAVISEQQSKIEYLEDQLNKQPTPDEILMAKVSEIQLIH